MKKVISIANKPQLLDRRTDLYEKFINLSQKHLRNVHADKLELTVRDVSGLSNPVYIVGVQECTDANNKIIIRFFESKAADFEIENQVFSIASKQQFGPGMIETDYKTFRVEQFFPGVPFKCEELRNKEVLEKCTKLICDFNYDHELLKIKKSALTCDGFMNDQKNGWYWVAKNEVLPIFEEIQSRLDPKNEMVKNAIEIIHEVKNVIFDNQNKFTQEFYELLPNVDKTSEMVVFSHNDIQENNFLHNASGVKIIDFEYSNYNFRGIDLASYINETTIEYGSNPRFQIHKQYFPNFDQHIEGTVDVDFMVQTYLENFYDKHLESIVPEYEKYDKYASKEVYMATEFPVMKEQLKSLVLFQDLYWVIWCLVMTKGPLVNPESGKVWEDDDKLLEMLEEAYQFYIPYAKMRLE